MLSYFLRELLNMRYSEFLEKSQSSDYAAIKEAINRIDGTVDQPIEIEYPKFITLYPNATKVKPGSSKDNLPVVIPKPDPINLELAGIRDTIKEMGETPAGVVDMLIKREEQIPGELKVGHVQLPDPMIKSLVSAHLFKLIQNGSYKAITELLNQIEGKVAEKIRVLGEDVYMTSFDTIAPPGSKKNRDGIYELENKKVTTLWETNLAKSLNK
jgi:hypothetical protein